MGLTRADLPLHQLLRDKAFNEPDRVAIVFGDRSLTFADLDTESNRLAHGLRALGLERGDRLALFTPNRPEFVVGFYAASKLGAIACPLNSSYREREITHQLNDSSSTILIAHAKLWPVIEASRSRLTRLRPSTARRRMRPSASWPTAVRGLRGTSCVLVNASPAWRT